MKTLIDFFPLLLFFGAYKLQDIYFATAVLMVSTVVQMAVIYGLDRKLQPMHKITLALIMVFGTLTLALHDDRFIKWKPTVLYTAMAMGIALAVWVLKKDVLQTLLGSQLELPNLVWHRLNIAWVLYCLFMAGSNAYVVLTFSTEAWVNFKIWGYIFPLTFIVGQGIYIAPFLKEKSEDAVAEAAEARKDAP